MPKVKNNERFNDKGVYFECGMGCAHHNNCFTCPFPPDECKFKETSQDMKYYNNRGNGIEHGKVYC